MPPVRSVIHIDVIILTTLPYRWPYGRTHSPSQSLTEKEAFSNQGPAFVKKSRLFHQLKNIFDRIQNVFDCCTNELNVCCQFPVGSVIVPQDLLANIAVVLRKCLL